MEIVFVGAGRLATQFAKALHGQGHTVRAVFSRTMASAQALCRLVGGEPVDAVRMLPMQADAYILAVKDSVLPALIPQLAAGREQQAFFHTAGSVPLSVFGSDVSRCGVIYPMQTFSKERDVDFSDIPLFIEGSDAPTLLLARRLAESVSRRVVQLSSDQRRYLHLAAVFACNFANHCYKLSADVLERQGLPFDVMLPLIEETARKVSSLHPLEAQTGPAVRYDENVIAAQTALLGDTPRLQQVYELMSRSIHEAEMARNQLPVQPHD